ncbi:MAG: tetraacyldisaccharide 4'-kinase [Candidatus Omnitrophota bacterium]|jgi:tetraacyldisaccharide 4'-kinase
MHKIKSWYIDFLEKKNLNTGEMVFALMLRLLSFIYAAIISARNLFYDLGLFPVYHSDKKVISIGNLSWSGSGKTTLAILLHEKLSTSRKLTVLRRGYGKDEEELLKEKGIKVFSSPDRASLTKKLFNVFDLFILDDGFQYRKLGRDINIVVMGMRELNKKWRILPAGIFREPLSSLKRADILIINYKDEAANFSEIKNKLQIKYPHLSVYGACYKFKQISDLDGRKIDISSLKDKKIAALAAIGYPQGFFNQITKIGVKVEDAITYPDHYEFTSAEFEALENRLKKESVDYCLITHKDKYHLPLNNHKVNFYIFEIEMVIDEESKFLEEISKKIN